jgi:hypothetical protein
VDGDCDTKEEGMIDRGGDKLVESETALLSGGRRSAWFVWSVLSSKGIDQVSLLLVYLLPELTDHRP